MALGVKYRAEFDTIKLNSVRIDILEDAFAGSITTLIVGGVNLRRPDGQFSKVEGIRESELVFQVKISDDFDPYAFLTTSDTQLRVNLYVNNILNWIGWIDPTNYKFEVRDGNYFVELSARDGLHLLENSKFEGTTDVEVFGLFKVNHYIYTCLKATGLIVSSTDYTSYNTWINIYPKDFPVRGAGGDTVGANDPLNNIYIDSVVFRTGVNEYDNCYIVLNKICSAFKATLFQYAGEWHFVYVEDWVRNIGLAGTKFNYENAAVSFDENVFTQIEIGLRKQYQLANDNAQISFTSIYSKARIELSYQNSDVKIKNQDFSKIDEATEVIDGTFGYQYYDLRDWTSSTTGTGGFANIMQTRFSDSNPLAFGDRWMQFRHPSSGTGSCTAVSVAIFVSLGDMFNLKFECGFTNSASRGNTTGSCYVYVTDGVTTKYLWSDGKWRTTPEFNRNIFNTGEPYPFSLSDPKTVEMANIEPMPMSGNMFIAFEIVNTSTVIDYTIFIKKIALDYKSYLGYGGRTDQVGRRRPAPGGQFYESSEEVKAKNEFNENTYLFNAPQASIPGAILDVDAAKLQLWKHKGITEEVPFGRIIADAIWKFVYRRYIKIQAGIFGVVSDNQIIANLHNIKFDFLPEKIFLLTSIDVDIREEQAEFTCVELLDETNTDDFDQLATTRKTGYISDLEGRRFNFYDRHYLWEPPDNAYGQLGRFVEDLFKKKRRRSR